MRINLTFIHVDIEEDRFCSYDALWINSNSAHCGKITKTWSIISDTNMMMLRFTSSQIITRKGFIAVWKAIEQEEIVKDCGNCVFPFEFGFRFYDTCTTIQGGDQPWCLEGPPVDEGTHNYLFLPDIRINCNVSDPLCPGVSKETTPQMSSHPDNMPGNCCRFSTQ